MKARYTATSCFLILILLVVSTPRFAHAFDGSPDSTGADEQVAIRLYANANTGPIGRVVSASPVSINGRVSSDEKLLWGGELLQAPPTRSVRVSLDSIGQITLNAGALAILTVTPKTFDDSIRGGILIASLVTGDLVVRLQDTAEAYVEASGSAVNAGRGASFRVGIGPNGPDVDAITGEVTIGAQVPQGNYSIRPVGGRAALSVRLRKSREVQVQVTDENDKPVPDVPIIFSLGGSGAVLGTGAATTVTVTTNALGIAATSVTGTAAGAAPSITATIAGTNVSTTISVSVAAAAGIAAGTTAAIVAAAAGATAATVAVATKNNNNNNQNNAQPSITPTGSPRSGP